jgi:cephalosporin hydroxylase
MNRIFIDAYGENLLEAFTSESKGAYFFDLAFDFSMTWKFKRFMIKPLQNKKEFLNFANFVFETIGKPSNVIEIGTANGGALFLFSRMVDVNSTILSIDINDYSETQLKLFQLFALNPSIKIQHIKADTRKMNVEIASKLMQEKLHGNGPDLIFIDADHSYEAVKNDFQTFFPFLQEVEIIGLHDINPDRGNGDPKFWEEIKKDNYYKEFREKTIAGEA